MHDTNPSLASTRSLIERRNGNVVDHFADEADALAYVRLEMDEHDEWALVRFGASTRDNELIAADADLLVLAHARTDATRDPR